MEDQDVAWMARRLREMGCELLAADDLAHEVQRMLRGMEPRALKKSQLQRALTAYLRARHPERAEAAD